MIIGVELKNEGKELPLDYRPALVSLIKAVMSRSYPQAYSEMYENGPTRKSFTFSVFLPKPKFGSEKITLEGDCVRLNISSGNDKDVLLLYNSFQKNREYEHPLKNGCLKVINVELKPSPEIAGSETAIRFLSPLVVREHDAKTPDKYYIYDDERFAPCLREVIKRQLGRDADIRLEPVKPAKTVVTAFGRKLRASLGIYKLSGETEAINELLRSGMGSRRSEGFGCFVPVGEVK